MYTHVAPPVEADADGLNALKASMTPSDTVALGGRLVVQVDSSSYAGALAAAAVETGAVDSRRTLLTGGIEGEAIARLLEHDGEGLSFELAETATTGNAERDRLRFENADEEGFLAHFDPESGTLYLVVDTGCRAELFDRRLAGRSYTARLAYEADPTERYRFAASDGAGGTDGPGFDAAAPFEGGADGDLTAGAYLYRLLAEPDAVETAVTFAEPTVRLNQTTDKTAFIERDQAADLVGTTNVAPGVTLQVGVEEKKTVEDVGAVVAPFGEALGTTVEPDGTVVATVDTAGGTIGQELSVTVRSGSRPVADIEGRLVKVPAAVAIERPLEADRQVDSVTVEAALPDGGFVAVHDGGFRDHDRAGSVRGVSDYVSAAGIEQIEINLDRPYRWNGTAIAAVYRDAPENHHFEPGVDTGAPYLNRGVSITDRALVTVARPPTTARVRLPKRPTLALAPTREAASGRNRTSGGSADAHRPPRTPRAAQPAGATTATNATAPPTTADQPGLGWLSVLPGLSLAALLWLWCGRNGRDSPR